MDYTPNLKTKYHQEIVPALMKEFGYSSMMRAPRLEKIVINQGVGKAIADKKVIEGAQKELTSIAGQKAVQTLSKKDISNFKLRRKMPIGLKVTLRRERMYEFMERLIVVALPRIRDFRGISFKFDGKGNYSLGIQEQIIFPEIELDKINVMLGMDITFVTTAQTDEEGYALLKEFGLPFKNIKRD
jgi:large subunit ribosomal protein L5